jgi:hypothetical protein
MSSSSSSSSSDHQMQRQACPIVFISDFRQVTRFCLRELASSSISATAWILDLTHVAMHVAWMGCSGD